MSENDIELYLVFFDEKSYSLSTELYGDIDEYINKHYVEEKVPEEYPDGVLGYCYDIYRRCVERGY